MIITLWNVSRRMRTFVLPHEPYCRLAQACACTVVAGRPPRRRPASISIPAGHRREVDAAALQVREVQLAVRAQSLCVLAPTPVTPPHAEGTKP